MTKLKELLIQYGCPKDSDVLEESFSVQNCSFRHLREIIVLHGTILEENEKEHTIVATLRINYNHATIAIKLKGGCISLLAYAKEGLIKQNTAQKAITKIKHAVSPSSKDNTAIPKRSFPFKKVFCGAILVIVLIIAILFVSAFLALDAIKKYNEAAAEFNDLVDEYNTTASQTSLANIAGVPTEIAKINIEKEDIWEGFTVVFGKNSIKKIKADTDTIYDFVDQLEYSYQIIEQITSPTGEWVESRLKLVEGITGTQAVTKDNNPDGLLGKEGGYSACIYFTVDKIDAETIKGNDIVGKGTDAGGAIEIYSSLADAEARCEYLAGFDGTILYSGSYAIIGTVVIRTSYILSNEEQFELTDKITQALTRE
jgi:hypothetical protein